MMLRTFMICLGVLTAFSGVAAQPAQNAPMRPSLTVMKRPAGFPLRVKQTREQKRKLTPDAEDAKRFEAFLERENTGLFRLTPDLGCQENMYVVRADETCLNAVPQGAYYSFREKEHTLESLADIRLKNGYLISDGVLAQGILIGLGDVPLEDVSLASESLKFLRNYLPPTASHEAHKHYVQVARGVRIGPHEYRKAVRAEEDATYALRVVAYRGHIFRTYRGFRYDLLGGDKRIDLTLVFRIVRRDADGTLTILWRELERRAAPRMKFTGRKKGGR